jgi:hypothetical protein
MGIYYLYFNPMNKECLPLGKKVDGYSYEGPVVYLSGKRYFLPRKYLLLLIKRFAGGGDVLLVPDYEIFDSEEYVSSDELIYKVGGGGAEDPPLSKYLPEINDSSVIEEIIVHGTLIE